MSPAKEAIPHYAQQLRERVRPDMITLGSLSLQQVRATKRNICVIIPYSPAHQPCPLCCVSVALANGHRVCACVRVHLSGLSIHMPLCIHVCVCYILSFLIFFLFFPYLLFLLHFLSPSFFFFFPNCHLYKNSPFHFQCRWFESQLNALM